MHTYLICSRGKQWQVGNATGTLPWLARRSPDLRLMKILALCRPHLLPPPPHQPPPVASCKMVSALLSVRKVDNSLNAIADAYLPTFGKAAVLVMVLQRRGFQVKRIGILGLHQEVCTLVHTRSGTASKHLPGNSGHAAAAAS